MVVIVKNSGTETKVIAGRIMKSGIKSADAFHVACAIFAESDYFITTDDRLLKFQTEEIKVVTPGEFIRSRKVHKWLCK